MLPAHQKADRHTDSLAGEDSQALTAIEQKRQYIHY